MPKFVEEKLGAVRPFRTLVAVLRDALPAVQFRAKRDALEFELVPLIRSPRWVRKHQRIGT